MGIKRYKPVTPGLRFKTTLDFSVLTDDKPLKALVAGKKRCSGRMRTGRISVRRRGGGHKRKLRIIDFRRDKYNIEAKVVSIQYDPNRSAHIALLAYKDGEKRYIIAPDGINVGETLLSGDKAIVGKVGHTMKLKDMPVGSIVHNVELEPGKGGQIARAAGTFAQITGFEKDKAIIKMPSGEIRLINSECYATFGVVSNLDHKNVILGKAGRSRWLGRRPKVRGVAMNPIDHPHGGGEGKTSGGRHPVSPWGVPTKGYKTRNPRKVSNRWIIRRRKK